MIESFFRLGLRQRLVLDQTAQVVVDEADDADFEF